MYLAIDTSTGTSVALVAPDGRALATRALPETMRHAEVVGTFIQEVLEEGGVAPRELSAVVAGMGPGPFTGLRIGIAAARAFGLGAGIPVHPLVSHDAVALEWYLAGGTGELLVVTDARRRELYWSSYTGLGADGIPARAAGPGLARPEDVPASPAAPGARLDAESVPAAALGALAARIDALGVRGALDALDARAAGWAADEPLYLRSPDIAQAGPKKRVTQ